MQTYKEFPAPIKEKFISLIVMGVTILIAGICASLIFKDVTMLMLSIIVFGFCALKAYSFYVMAATKNYESVKGACLSTSNILIRKQKKIRIIDGEGNERSFILNRHSKVSIGKEYIFYFKATRRISLGSEYLDSALSSDCFLGYEEVNSSD